MNDADAIRLENRLTKLEGLPKQIEELGVSLTNQINVVLAESRDTRRVLDLHLTKDEQWMDDHNQKHAFSEGVTQGKSDLRKSDMAIMGAFFTVLALILTVAGPTIQKALGVG